MKKIDDIEKNNRTLLDQQKALQKEIKKTNKKAFVYTCIHLLYHLLCSYSLYFFQRSV